MAEQNYSNHTQRVPLFLASVLTLLLSFIGASVIFFHSMERPAQHHVAMLIAAVSVAGILGVVTSRQSALKAQDRAIRAEENLRHYAMTSKLLDKRLTGKQIIALRFASDDQFLELAREAADQNMTPDAVKRAVKSWRPDTERA